MDSNVVILWIIEHIVECYLYDDLKYQEYIFIGQLIK